MLEFGKQSASCLGVRRLQRGTADGLDERLGQHGRAYARTGFPAVEADLGLPTSAVMAPHLANDARQPTSAPRF